MSEKERNEIILQATNIADADAIDSLTQMLLELIDEKLKEYKKDNVIDLNEELSISIFKNSINSQIGKINPLIILKEQEVLDLVALIGTLQNRKLILTQEAQVKNISNSIEMLKRERNKLEEKIQELQLTVEKRELENCDDGGILNDLKEFKIASKYLISELKLEDLFSKLMSTIDESSTKYNELHLLKYKFKSLQKDKRNDIISRIDYNREMNVFTVSCIDFIDELTREDLKIKEDGA